MDLLAEHLSQDQMQNRLTDAEITEQVDCLTELATSPDVIKALMPSAYALIRSAPSDPRPQLLAATLLERSRVREHMTETWAALFDRFPHLNTALRYWIRWLNREKRTDEAVALLQRLFDDEGQTDEDLIHQAELYGEIRDPEASDRLFEQLVARFPDNVRIRVIFGKTLFSRGDILRAFEILDPVRDQNLSRTAKSVLEQNDRAILAMEAIRPNSATISPSGPAALYNAIALFHNRVPRPIAQDEISGVAFYTGSLGAGGAERQLTQIASTFHHRSRTNRRIDGTRITGKVEVIVNSTDADRGKDFFLSVLETNGVPLSITTQMPTDGLSSLSDRLEILEDLAPILPTNARFGLDRLVAHFQKNQPDVAYIWQDGAVLTGALAALVAGVPRIAISLRGLPPNLRPHLMKPEYKSLYKALALVPGVSFSCNSRTAADAYGEWLDIPSEQFSVLYNAVRPLASEPQDEDKALCQSFEEATPDATFTLGGVFRCTPNKRGLTWVEFAARTLRRFPTTRFIHVGDGEELDALRTKAVALGIDQRILFVGRSACPGFWYKNMDAVLLLSENEGLPNVLIEAQISGKPVISTPAGGARETFLPGSTGYLLSSAASPDINEFMAHFTSLVESPAICRSMGQAARDNARARFSLDHILSQTVRHLHGAHVVEHSDMPPPNNVTPMPRTPRVTAPPPRVREAYNIFAEN